MVKSIKKAPAVTLSPEVFVLAAINEIKEEGKKGLTSWKLNPALREYYGADCDPVALTTDMRKNGKIAVFLQRGGATFYLREDLKESTLVRHDEEWMKRDAEVFKKDEKKPLEKDDFLEKILRRST